MTNVTALHDECGDWDIHFDALFHIGCLFQGAAFVLPQTYAFSRLLLRGLVTVGFVLQGEIMISF